MRFFLWLVPTLVCSTAMSACNSGSGARGLDSGTDPDPEHTAEAGADGSPSVSDAAPPADAGWSVVLDLDAPVLSVWGTSSERAFFVGERGLVLERDGDRWWRWSAPTSEALWWVWGRAEDDVFAGGEGGTLMHFDGGAWTHVPTGLDEEDTIWGIWGSGEAVWLVGGRARTNGPGFILEGDAHGFGPNTVEDLPSLYKVWGTSRRDVWVVGDRSSIYRLEPGRLVEQDLGPVGDTPEPLFTISGNRRTLLAVGGISQGLVFEWESDEFEALPFATAGLNGVSVNDSGEVVVVGLFGVIRERVADDWVEHDLELERHYHATSVFDDGAYAVGGDILASGERRRGLIVGRGAAVARNVRVEARASLERDAGVQNGGAGGVQSSIPDAAVGGASGEPEAGAHGGPREAGLGRPVDAETPTSVEGGYGLLGPGAICVEPEDCAEGLECWGIQGLGELRCVAPCTDASDCSEDFGEAPQCTPPGCQTTMTVCLRAEWEGCVL